MIGVDKIDDIRRLGRNGATVASIARDTGVSEPTVRKYLREPDLSERPPAVGRAPESPLVEPFAALIDSWLLEDRRCWRKLNLNLNLPRFRLHPYAAIGWRSSSGQLARSNSSGLRYPSAECVLTLL